MKVKNEGMNNEKLRVMAYRKSVYIRELWIFGIKK